MRGYARLIGAHPRVLASGVLLTLFSGFGQTFLISLFVPDLLAAFGLDKIGFGALYSAATLGAALAMPYFGRLLDRSTVPSVTLLAAAILMSSCALVALSPGPAWLFAGVLGLRLGGQGMFGLIAAASMARHFDAHRGRALGVASLGYPLGEAMLPAAVMTLIGAFGWRWSMGIMGAVILLVFLPVVLRLMRGAGVPALTGAAAAARSGKKSAVRTLLADPSSRAVLLVFLVPPFALTGLFLYQALLCEYKGWPPAVMAGGFAAFAAARFAGYLIQSGGGYGTFLLSLGAVTAAGAAIPFFLNESAPLRRAGRRAASPAAGK